MAFPTSWGRRCALVIQSSEVVTTCSGFPTLVTEDTLPSEIFDADGSFPAINGGGDIRFSSDASGETQLACEIEQFVTDNDPANGKASIWVNIPTVSSGTNTTFYIWYNKAGKTQPAEASTYGKESVWDTNYKMVQHLNQDPSGSSPQMTDSTSNDNDGTSAGTMLTEDQVDGKIDGCLEFDGTDDHINAGHGTDLDITGNATVEMWVNATSWTDEINIVSYSEGGETSDTNSFYGLANIGVDAGDILVGHEYDAGVNQYQVFNTNLSTGTWHHLVEVRDATAKTWDLYVNGSKFGATYNYGTNPNGGGSNTLRIGCTPYVEDPLYFDGFVDEVRVSNTIRTAGWIETEYNNQNAPGTFLVEGTPETPFLIGWGRRCELVIQSSQVTNDETDYPLVIKKVNLPDELFDADGSYPALNGGGDIRISSDEAGTTQLPCEIEILVTDNDPANGKATVWVKVPNISSSSDTSIWIWYNKAGETQPAADAEYGREAVWNINYKYVFHMNDLTTSTVLNSTGGPNGTKLSANNPIETEAKIAKGQDFVDDYIVTSDTGFNPEADFTVSVWATGDDFATTPHVIFAQHDGDGEGLGRSILLVSPTSYPGSFLGGTTSPALSTISTGTFYLLIITYDHSANEVTAHINNDGGNTTTETGEFADGDLVIGNSKTYGQPFNGILDEFRISDIVRSDGWIETEYNNQNSPATFIIEGTPETPVVGWVGTFNGIPSTSISKINGIALADILKVNGISSS